MFPLVAPVAGEQFVTPDAGEFEMTMSACAAQTPPRDPAQGHDRPWPMAVVAILAVAGLLSPLVPLAGSLVAFAIADRDQGTILGGAALMHLVLTLTLMAGA